MPAVDQAVTYNFAPQSGDPMEQHPAIITAVHSETVVDLVATRPDESTYECSFVAQGTSSDPGTWTP